MVPPRLAPVPRVNTDRSTRYVSASTGSTTMSLNVQPVVPFRADSNFCFTSLRVVVGSVWITM